MEIQIGGAVDVAGTGRMALYYGNLNGCTEGLPAHTVTFLSNMV